jgi:hypothetical protein
LNAESTRYDTAADLVLSAAKLDGWSSQVGVPAIVKSVRARVTHRTTCHHPAASSYHTIESSSDRIIVPSSEASRLVQVMDLTQELTPLEPVLALEPLEAAVLELARPYLPSLLEAPRYGWDANRWMHSLAPRQLVCMTRPRRMITKH